VKQNLKLFFIKAGILSALFLIVRAVFQFPIEYYGLEYLKQNTASRVISKIDMLKVIVFVGILASLYYRKTIEKINHVPFEKNQIIALFYGLLSICTYYLVRYMSNMDLIGNFLTVVLTIIILTLAAIYLAISVYNIKYLIKLQSKLKRSILILPGILILYVALEFFQSKWLFFSKYISVTLFHILRNFYQVYLFQSDLGPQMWINGFAVLIGPPCSGIDSLFLFFAFFLGLFALDHKKIKTIKYLVALVIGLAGVILVNILRLLLLLLVGVHGSPELAVGLFHTNAGWVLFVLYFICYYVIIRKFIYKKTRGKTT